MTEPRTDVIGALNAYFAGLPATWHVPRTDTPGDPMTTLPAEVQEVLRWAEAFALLARNKRMTTDSAEHCRRRLIAATDTYVAAAWRELHAELAQRRDTA